MKHLYALFITVFLLNSQFITLRAQNVLVPDSIQISLLTCSPHDEVYSLYGHTALRVENRQNGMDVAVNYGMFSFDKPFFVLRFVFGLTDYTMGIVPFENFCREYEYYGSSVTQQVLNLSPEDKVRILSALEYNYHPENRIYRYNYFYNNCTTKAVEIIADNLNGKIVYSDTVPDGMTFRKMLHSMTKNNPWAQLGNDLLLGYGADREMTLDEYHFLPHSMLAAIDSAYIVRTDNSKCRAVKDKFVVVEEGVQVVSKAFPFSPMACSVAFLLLNVLLSFAEWRTKKYFWLYDVFFLFLIGLAGVIITSMIFSLHPTVSLNAQILLLNPLPLVFGYQAISKQRRNVFSRFWLMEILLVSSLLMVYSFGVQVISPPVLLLALSLLVRCGVKMLHNDGLKEKIITKNI